MLRGVLENEEPYGIRGNRASLGGVHFRTFSSRRSLHAFLLIKIFPNATIKSHAIITVIAAPDLYLSRFFVPAVSVVTDAWAVGVLGTLALAARADKSFAATGVSFLTEGCAVDALGNVPQWCVRFGDPGSWRLRRR